MARKCSLARDSKSIAPRHRPVPYRSVHIAMVAHISTEGPHTHKKNQITTSQKQYRGKENQAAAKKQVRVKKMQIPPQCE